MRTSALLGLAALGAFLYYCFTREGRRQAQPLATTPPARAPRAGDGSASRRSPASAAPAGTRFPEGDPTVRH